MPKYPPWKIRIGRKAEIIGEFEVPCHRLGTNDLKTFLRALVVRYRTETPEDMAAFYVNRHRGSPDRLPFADTKPSFDFERCLTGYFCGEWECWAEAMQAITPKQARAIKNVLEETQRGNA